MKDDDRPQRVQLVAYTPGFWEEVWDMASILGYIALAAGGLALVCRLAR